MYNSESLGVFWVLLAEKDFDRLDNLDVQDIRGGHSEELIVGLVVHFQPLVDSVNRCKLQLRLSELATHTCNTKPLFCQKLLLFAHICVTTRWTQPISSGKSSPEYSSFEFEVQTVPKMVLFSRQFNRKI